MIQSLLICLLSTQLSADGRSVVGQDTWADKVVSYLQPDKLLIGLDSAQLSNYGHRVYPELKNEWNRPGHALGAYLLTKRFGFIAAQSLGIANELWEAWVLGPYVNKPYFSEERFDWGDVAANVYGGIDAELSYVGLSLGDILGVR